MGSLMRMLRVSSGGVAAVIVVVGNSIIIVVVGLSVAMGVGIIAIVGSVMMTIVTG